MQQKGSKGNEYSMRIKDDDDDGQVSTYAYSAQRVAKASYALVFDPAKQTFVLEKVGASINCNITSTPWESDRAKLEELYPHLEIADDTQEAVEDDLFSESEDVESSDEENPFDHRMWLDNEGPFVASSPRVPPLKPSPVPRPVNGISASVSPAPRPIKAPPQQRMQPPSRSSYRDDADDESSQARRPTGRPQPPAAAGATVTAAKRALAKSNVLRGAEAEPPAKRAKVAPRKRPAPNDDDVVLEFDSLPSAAADDGHSSLQTVEVKSPPPVHSRDVRDQNKDDKVDGKDDESDGGLVIEMEPETRPKRSLGQELGRMTSGGPVSLSSVASSLSPTPAQSSPVKPQAREPDLPLQMREADDNGDNNNNNEDDNNNDNDDDDDDDDDDMEDQSDAADEGDVDVDVDDLKLPPPVLEPNDTDMTNEADDVISASDLEAELEQALVSEFDDEADGQHHIESNADQPPPPPVQIEEPESEEE